MDTLQQTIDLVASNFVCNGDIYPDLKHLPKERHKNTTIKHSVLHLMKSVEKISGECENYDHGGEFNDQVAKRAVLSGFTTLCKIADELGMKAEDIYAGIPEILKFR